MNILTEKDGETCISLISFLMILTVTFLFSEDLVVIFQEIQPLFNSIFFSFSSYVKF